MESLRGRIVSENYENLLRFGRIRPDDQKMSFCARQAAEIICAEHMEQLIVAYTIVEHVNPNANPAEYADLKKVFDEMIIATIKELSALADEHGIAQY
jgi:uncharacterized protein with ParB-like and HNH nuclease domain